MNPIEDWLNQPDGLAPRLRALRERAGLAGKDLAAATGWQPSKVSRLENGRTMPSRDDLRTWIAACGADDAVLQELLALLGEVQAFHQDWKRRLRRGGHAAVQATYYEMVRDARLVQNFEVACVPGLLQTPEYARAMLTESAAEHGVGDGDLDDAVASRLARQQFLYEAGRKFEFIVTEAVLRFLLVPPEVMRGQLDRLQSIIGAPNIRFGVIPFGVRLATTPQNSFLICDDTVVLETFVEEVQPPPDVAASYLPVMKVLWESAVTGDAARRLISDAAEALP